MAVKKYYSKEELDKIMYKYIKESSKDFFDEAVKSSVIKTKLSLLASQL